MRVWVTRDEPNDGPLSTALRNRGLAVVLEPVLERRVRADALEAVGRLGPDDWLVLTSPYAIEAFAALAGRVAKVPQLAVVAESSRRLAEALGLRVELVSPEANSKSLFQEMRTRVTEGTVCYPRSSQAAAPEPWPGVELRCPILYETSARAFDRTVIARVEVVSVASASAVRAVGPVNLPFASIGGSTSAELRRMGPEPWVEAAAPSFESLADAIAAQADEPPHQRA